MLAHKKADELLCKRIHSYIHTFRFPSKFLQYEELGGFESKYTTFVLLSLLKFKPLSYSTSCFFFVLFFFSSTVYSGVMTTSLTWWRLPALCSAMPCPFSCPMAPQPASFHPAWRLLALKAGSGSLWEWDMPQSTSATE